MANKTAKTNVVSTRKRGPKEKYPFDRLWELRYKNAMSYGEIAKYCGVNKKTIITRFQRFARMVEDSPSASELGQYIKDRADYHALRRMRTDSFVTDDKLQKSSAYQLTIMSKMIGEEESLERGNATVIHGYDTMNSQAVDLQGELDRLNKLVPIDLKQNEDGTYTEED